MPKLIERTYAVAVGLEYAIKKVLVNQVGMKLNGTYQLLAYADDMNLLGDNVDTIKKMTETLIDASKEVIGGKARGKETTRKTKT
jgi:hypothetical protein